MAVRICPWMGGITQGAMDGGAYMPMDGRYNAMNHGCRCVYVQDIWSFNQKLRGMRKFRSYKRMRYRRSNTVNRDARTFEL